MPDAAAAPRESAPRPAATMASSPGSPASLSCLVPVRADSLAPDPANPADVEHSELYVDGV
jgi:hypothetical protein